MIGIEPGAPATAPGSRRLPVVYVESTCRSALNPVRGMDFNWSLNPYTGCAHRCTFCYVRAFELRAGRPSGEGYGRTVRVKTNVVEVLRAELGRRSWRSEVVCIGAATDPYQPVEGRYRLTRGCLEALLAARTPVTIITRGTLVVRDADVLRALARVAAVSVSVSVPTLDPAVVRRTEPGTPPPAQRLRAVRTLVDAGIHAGVAMAPLLPGISDGDASMAAVVRAAREAGATHLWAGALRLAPGTREHFLEALARDWPHLVGEYLGAYAGGASLPAARSAGILDRAHRLRDGLGIADRRPPPVEPPPAPRQLALI